MRAFHVCVCRWRILSVRQRVLGNELGDIQGQMMQVVVVVVMMV